MELSVLGAENKFATPCFLEYFRKRIKRERQHFCDIRGRAIRSGFSVAYIKAAFVQKTGRIEFDIPCESIHLANKKLSAILKTYGGCREHISHCGRDRHRAVV